MSRSFQNEDCSPNQLLSSLSAEDYARLVPHLRTVKLALGDVICQGSGNFGFAYFPTNSVVSLICDMEDGATVEVALTGNDGVLGTSIFLDGKATANRAIVGIAGEAVRMEARVLRDQFVRGGTFQRYVGRTTGNGYSRRRTTSGCRTYPLQQGPAPNRGQKTHRGDGV